MSWRLYTPIWGIVNSLLEEFFKMLPEGLEGVAARFILTSWRLPRPDKSGLPMAGGVVRDKPRPYSGEKSQIPSAEFLRVRSGQAQTIWKFRSQRSKIKMTTQNAKFFGKTAVSFPRRFYPRETGLRMTGGKGLAVTQEPNNRATAFSPLWQTCYNSTMRRYCRGAQYKERIHYH